VIGRQGLHLLVLHDRLPDRTGALGNKAYGTEAGFGFVARDDGFEQLHLRPGNVDVRYVPMLEIEPTCEPMDRGYCVGQADVIGGAGHQRLHSLVESDQGGRVIGFCRSHPRLRDLRQFVTLDRVGAPRGETTEQAFQRSPRLPARITVDNSDTMADLVRRGWGLVQAPRYRFAQDLAGGQLVEVLGAYPPDCMPLSALYSPNRQMARSSECSSTGSPLCSRTHRSEPGSLL
jgi:hypothetical protein